jgi:hypothetical protein
MITFSFGGGGLRWRSRYVTLHDDSTKLNKTIAMMVFVIAVISFFMEIDFYDLFIGKIMPLISKL